MMSAKAKKTHAVKADRAERRRAIRRRTDNRGSLLRPRKATVRMTAADSAALMQWQGLARRFGKKSMAWLWHNVCAPALKAHCEAQYVPLARKAAEAAKARKADKAAKEAVA